MAADGQVLASERIADGVVGVARLHELIAGHASDPAEVAVGIETDRGLLVGALVVAGYQVYAVNPLAASRYRERHTTSRAKSDRGDARMLADLVRTDRHRHRQVAGDSGLAEAVKVLARGHQQLVWARQRQANLVRSALRALDPAALAAFGGDLGGRDAVAVLALARPLTGVGCCRMRMWSGCCGGQAVGAGSTPALPASGLRFAASSCRPRRWSPPPTGRWWRPRWRSSAA
jgi:hypothetical protein